jgi:glycosyltransferase involved in cell wall biosynthesis
MKKKIVIVGSSLKDKGGIVTVIKGIIHSSIKDKYDLTVVESYISGSVFQKIFILLNAIIKYFIMLLLNRVDLVHIHMSYKGSFYRASFFILLSTLFRKPIVLHAHGSSFAVFYNSLNEVGKKYCSCVLNKVNVLIVLSETWKDFYSRIVKKEKIKIVYNGVYVDNTILNKRKHNPRCLFLGRIGQRKGVYDLIKAFNILNKSTNGQVYLNLTIAGDGEVEKARSLVNQYKLDNNISIIGWVNEKGRDDLLINSDILILPSYNEGLPMSILEAMNKGLSIISTNVGGIPEIIKNGKNGILIKPGDIDSLVKNLKKIISNYELRKCFELSGKKIIQEKFDNHKIIAQFNEIYNTILTKEQI